jgi:uncharacterized protein (TIGR02996 family)
MSSPLYRRTVPDPLPVEPYFQKLPGSEAFLRAIAEEPLEDLHRLALADWLDDHGQAPRAAFIRSQCQLEQLPVGHAAVSTLSQQAQQLLRQHGKEWAVGLPRGARWAEEAHFRCGMLEWLAIDVGRGKIRTEPLFRSVDVRRLNLSLASGERLRRLLDAPWLPHLTHLECDLTPWGAPVANEDLELLANCSKVHRVVELRILRAYEADHFAILSRMFRFPHLQRLALWVYALDEQTASALEGDLVRIGLRELHLEGIHAPALSILARASLAGLHTLSISSQALRSAAFETLAETGSFPALRELNLFYTPLAVKGMKALVGWPLLSQITVLGLGGTSLNGDAVRVLARSPAVTGLRVLDLSPNNYIRKRGLLALAESPYLTNLESLSLPYLGVDTRGADVLLRSGVLANLTALNLRGSGLRSLGAALVSSSHLDKLAFLDVRANLLSAKAKAAIRERWPFALI